LSHPCTNPEANVKNDEVLVLVSLLKEVLIGYIAIGVENDILVAPKEFSPRDMLGEYLEISTSQWNKLEDIWCESEELFPIAGNLVFSFFPIIYVYFGIMVENLNS